MPKGGRRPGSGRKKGSLSTRTREIAERAIAEGMTPLDVMLRAMREHAAGERWDDAARAAALAAPYIHPRLAAIEHAGKDGGPLQVIIKRFSDGN